ncbi:MAG: DUF192 domain-containing protein [Ottowia sp.]|nr:DUF192 domain-containing protein [Ottowia sp.]
MPMQKNIILYIHTQQHIQSITCLIAQGFWSRAQGLLWRPPLLANEGFLLQNCRYIHTIAMRTCLDIIYLNKSWHITHCTHHLPPWRASGCPHAQHTLELSAGEIKRLGIYPGQFCELHHNILSHPPSIADK